MSISWEGRWLQYDTAPNLCALSSLCKAAVRFLNRHIRLELNDDPRKTYGASVYKIFAYQSGTRALICMLLSLGSFSLDLDTRIQVWDLKDLGLQAAQRICSASDPLRSLSDISQNFPNLAAVLSRTAVSKELRAELRRNQAVLPSGRPPCSPQCTSSAALVQKVLHRDGLEE